MRLLILIASCWVLVASKPEMYKEKEDFQYSRSSSDDGTKSGFYGAQRGNMGGNYERAHNMDSLAQHHMSTLVRNVDGELGEAANTKTGTVFSSANSRGLYGSGNYDLSNLRGRHFGEAISGDSLSQSALSQNSGYLGYSGYGNLYSAANKFSSSQAQNSGLSSGYQTSGLASQYSQTDAQKAVDSIYSASNYNYATTEANQYEYAQSSNQAQSNYENTNSDSGYDYKTRNSLTYATPVRVYIKPGTRVAIPVAAQVYDAAAIQGINTVHSDSEIFGTTGQRIQYYKPTNNAKHYESSYNYRKEWQKHDSIPVTVAPTESPIPANSELYEDAQLSQTANNQYGSELASAANSQSSSANSAYLSGYSASTKNALSSQSQHQSRTYNSGASASNAYNYGTGASNAYNSGSSASNAYKSGASDTNAYTHNAYDASLAASLHGSHISDGTANSNNFVEDIASRPKSYHSSYSYHKSWERRGDPYVIKPVGGDLTSQKLTLPTCTYCLDESQQRVRRSINNKYHQSDNLYDAQEDMGQQSMSGWEQDLAELGQQTQNKWDELQSFNQQPQNQFGNLEDLGQQTQNQWDKLEDLGQQPQSHWGKLEDLGQQTQDKLEDLGQQTQSHWGKLEDLGQQTQDKLEDLGQQTQSHWGKLEDLGQQTQDKLEDLGQQTQSHWGKLEDLGQQTQDKLEDLGQQTQSHWGKLEDLGQHTQDKLEDLGQQTQLHWGKLEDLGQQTQDKLEDLGQQTQSHWGKLEDLGQHTQDKLEDLGQQTQSHWGKLEDLGQQTQDKLEDLGQQTQSHWGKLEDFGQHTQDKLEDLGQQTQSHWGKLEDLGQQTQDKLEDLGQQTQSHWGKLEDLGQQTQHKLEDLGQQTQSHWGKLENLGQQTQHKLEDLGQQTQNQWDNLRDLTQQTHSHWGKLEDLGQQTTLNEWDKLGNFNQQAQSHLGNSDHLGQQTQLEWGKLEDLGQQTQSHWSKIDLDQQTQSKWDNLENVGQQSQNKWSHFDNLGHQENLGHQGQTWSVANSQGIQNTANHYGGYQFNKSWTVAGSYVPYYTNYREVPGPYYVQESMENINKRWNCHNLEHGSYFHNHNFDNKDSQGATHNSDISFDISSQDHSEKPKENTAQHSEGKLMPKIDTNIQREITTIKYVTSGNQIPETTQKTINTDKVQEKNTSLANIPPMDIGRGDIGPEDISIEITKINENNNYKTPEEIESLSLTKDQRDISKEPLNLSVTGLNQQSEPENKQNLWNKLSTVIESVTTSTAKPKENLENNMNFISIVDNYTPKSNFLITSNNAEFNEKQNESKQIPVSDDQQEFFIQNNMKNLEPFEEHLEPFGKQNMGHNLEPFEEQIMVQQLEPFEKQNLGQHSEPLEEQYNGQQLENFEWQNWGQQMHSFDQQNIAQNLEPFEKQMKPHEKQNIEQIETSQKFVGQLQNFDKKNSRHLDLPEEQTVRMNSHGDFAQVQDFGQISADRNILQNSQTSSKQLETSPENKYVQQQIEPYKSHNVEFLTNQDDISTPIEPSTEKPGFWGSVWNKTKSAKDSVISWFHS